MTPCPPMGEFKTILINIIVNRRFYTLYYFFNRSFICKHKTKIPPSGVRGL